MHAEIPDKYYFAIGKILICLTVGGAHVYSQPPLRGEEKALHPQEISDALF
jgi:hypothetical protein